MSNVSKLQKREPDGTKSRILTAAAKHFGAYGFEGASLRNILADAETNVAAANYHFGSKAGLYRAVIVEYFNRTRAHRLALFDEAELSPPGLPRLYALTRAFMRPHFELVIGEGEHSYGRLLIKLLAETPSADLQEVVDGIRPSQTRYLEGLRACQPHASDELLATGVGLVIAALVHAPFNPSLYMFTGRPSCDQDLESLLDSTVSFAVGGLSNLLGIHTD